MNGNNGNDNNGFFDFLQIVSVMLGIINIQENRLQSSQNDVQSANDEQAKYLLQQIEKKFEKQNAILERILELLEKENKQNVRDI